MKRHLLKLTPLLFIFLLACNSSSDHSLNSIVDLYGGKFSLEYGIRASISNGKENYVKMVCEENSMISNRWLTPEAMANNCAVLFAKSNPEVIERKDFLEVEINDGNEESYKFYKSDLNELRKDYTAVERTVRDLVNHVRSMDWAYVKNLMEPTTKLTDDQFISFLTTFRSSFPEHSKGIKIIGYRTSKNTERIYTTDFVIAAQDEIHQKMANATLVSNGKDLRFREINF